MDLKNAVAVCLISLFSATLVVLIARSLDLDAASRIEPQLERIVAELEALRRQGGIAAASGSSAVSDVLDDGLMVYFFHGVRCPTCRAAEANSHAMLQARYADELESGRLTWRVLDYVNDPGAAAMARQFEVADPTIVLVRMKEGQLDTWKRLPRVLALARDKPALSTYLRDEIDKLLETRGTAPESGGTSDGPAIPVPADDADDPPDDGTDDSPGSPDLGDIPVPE